MGLYSEETVPFGRGFNYSFGYLEGEEHHFTQLQGGGPAHPTGATGVDLWRDAGPAYGENGTYGGFLYTTEAVTRISEHESKHGAKPMFMYLAYQVYWRGFMGVGYGCLAWVCGVGSCPTLCVWAGCAEVSADRAPCAAVSDPRVSAW
jgi:hypothetical protein